MIFLDRRSPVPLHYQFKQSMLERFENGEFPPGTPIPPEMDLMRDYAISRATVRRALQEMEHLGYINRIPGKGTFVLRTRIKRGLSQLTSFSEDMQERGQQVTSKLLDFGNKVPPAYVAEMFQIPPKTPLLYIYRLRMAENLPLALNISYIHLPADTTITEDELNLTVSLWGLLARKGLQLIEADKVIEAIQANEERAALLNIPVGSALLMVESMAYSLNHLPVEYSQVISSGERYKYSLHQEG